MFTIMLCVYSQSYKALAVIRKKAFQNMLSGVLLYSSLFLICNIFFFTLCNADKLETLNECSSLTSRDFAALSKSIVPVLEDKRKGEAGKIGVIGGSLEYTGAPYFAAITALKTGADLAYVITTESAATVIKSYSPDLIVYPLLNAIYINSIKSLLPKMDVVVIGPGLGRENETMYLMYDIINACKALQKPLIIDADGLYAVSQNVNILNNYPSPGVILTPNQKESEKLKRAIIISSNSSVPWYHYWGNNVAVLIKGKQDHFYSSETLSSLELEITRGGTGRRVGGQGDILAGALGTFYNWALKSMLCDNEQPVPIPIAQSVAVYAAAKFTRNCNSLSFEKHGRSMTASDMLHEIHPAFQNVFEN